MDNKTIRELDLIYSAYVLNCRKHGSSNVEMVGYEDKYEIHFMDIHQDYILEDNFNVKRTEETDEYLYKLGVDNILD